MAALIESLADNSVKLKEKGYTYVAALDFGTSNSGVVWGTADKDIKSEFNYANRKQGASYAKVPTVLVVKKEVLEKLASLEKEKLIFGGLGDDVIDDVNVYFGEDADEFLLEDPDQNPLNEGWVRFEYFKMALHNGNGRVRGSDGKEYDLQGIIELYIRGMVENAYDNMKENGVDVRTLKGQPVLWGLTIPTVWEAEEKTIMENAAKKALDGQDPVFILEPEGAAMSFANNNNIDLDNGKVFMVVDCGGGTTDIVVQKVIQNSGVSSIEEVLRSQGNAEAGWEMDKLFFRLLAEKLAEISGEVPKEDAYKRFIEDFYEEDITGKLELDESWMKYKHQTQRNDEIYFECPMIYASWLHGKFEKVFFACRKRNGIFVKINLNDIRQNVYVPVGNKIVELMETMYEELDKKNIKLDYIFGAGGLIALEPLQDLIKDHMPDYMDADSDCFFASNESRGNHVHGGTIMQGAACHLVFGDCVRRISKRYYYTQIFYHAANLAETLWQKQWKKMNITKKDFDKLFKEEIGKAVKEDSMVLALIPLCAAGNIAEKYESEKIGPKTKNQKTVELEVFSSTEPHLFFAAAKDAVRHETGDNGKKCVSFKITDPDKKYVISIDFNQFQQNYFDVVVREADSSNVVDTIRIKPEIKNSLH